jgi:hypothetical protein
MEQIVKFQSDNIIAKIIDGKIYVAIRPICLNLGLDADNALAVINKDEVLKEKVLLHPVQVPENVSNTTPEPDEHRVQVDNFEENSELNTVKNQNRLFSFLPLEYMYGWLFQIKITNTMKPETKEKLKIYKEEVYKILYEHFFGASKKILENVSKRSNLSEEKNKLVLKQEEIKARIKEIETQLQEIDQNNKNLMQNNVRQLELSF